MVIPDSIFRTHHVVAVVVMVVVKTAVRVGCRGLQCWAEIRLDNVLYQQGADGSTSSVSLVVSPDLIYQTHHVVAVVVTVILKTVLWVGHRSQWHWAEIRFDNVLY